jgi:hypothetical protein
MSSAPQQQSMDPTITEVDDTSSADSAQGHEGWDLAAASITSPRSDGSQAAKVHAGPSSSSGPSVQTVQAAAKQAPGTAEGPTIQLVEPAPVQTGPTVAAAASQPQVEAAAPQIQAAAAAAPQVQAAAAAQQDQATAAAQHDQATAAATRVQAAAAAPAAVARQVQAAAAARQVQAAAAAPHVQEEAAAPHVQAAAAAAQPEVQTVRQSTVALRGGRVVAISARQASDFGTGWAGRQALVSAARTRAWHTCHGIGLAWLIS